MATPRALPPVWLMGFGFLPLGASGAVMLITIPQLLAANHVPEQQIAGVTAIGLLPGFCSFILAPVLDWRFSRRAYAIAFALVAAVCTYASLLCVGDLKLLTALLFTGGMAIGLCVAAVGGWFGNLVSTDKKGALGAWFTVANIGTGGVVASVAISLLRGLPYALGAGLISLLVLGALPLYLWTACPPADRRLASESFRDFARDVLALLRKPSVLWTLFLFLSPCASFALTNILGGLGRDFSVPERLVGLIGGVGAVFAGVVGSLMVPGLAKKVEPRALYLLVGGVGAIFTLTLVLFQHNQTTFGVAMLGENVFQAAAFSVSNAIILRTIGHDNPLAATQFGLLNAASSLPLVYMQALDGQGYGFGGANGSFLADALISGAVCVAFALVLWGFRKRVPVI